MSKKHILGLICAMFYLVVVGFADLPSEPKKVDNGELIPMLPIESTLTPNQSTSLLSYEDFVEKEKAAKAIVRKYKRVDYVTAMQVTSLIYVEARKHKLDPKLVLALVATESSFNPKSLSVRGARGYTQVIPKWHRDKISGRNIWDTKVNIEVGVKILKDCFVRNRTEYSALACYNGAITPSKAVAYKQSIDKNKRYFLAAIRSSRWG